MSIPRAASNSARSAFVAIDPVTEEYHRIAEPGNTSKLNLTKRPRKFFAISYVWSDWKELPTDHLPSWDQIRNRLLQLTTTNIAATIDATGTAGGLLSSAGPPETFRCWIDCKCIDQTSPADKAFWVPRMNQVFYDACCTILLLRDLDLTGLYELFRITKCMFLDAPGHARSTSELSQHRCLFAPNCISLTAAIPEQLELLCLATIQALWNGEWRRRAWVFQEILLSERYVLCWGDSSSVAYIELETVGYIAAFLHSRHPEMSWLTDFWVWCKQCSYLRQFYSENCEMESTILQLAENLEASVPCDKYYALCGILDLDSVPYNPSHTAEQALDNVISALTRQGRMGWIYAVPPSIQRDGIIFSSQRMAPFMLTRKKKQISAIEGKECFFSSSFIGLNVVEQGKVVSCTDFGTVLSQLQTVRDALSHEHMTSGGRRGFLKDCYQGSSLIVRRFATILFRLAYDTINHFRDRNLLSLLFRSLDRWGLNTNLLDEDPECCFWYTLTSLYFTKARSIENIDDGFSREVVRRSAQDIQRVCTKLVGQGWQILEWQHSLRDGKGNSTPKSPEPKLAAYCGNFPVQGRTLWSVQTKKSTKSILFIASDHGNDLGSSGPYLSPSSLAFGHDQFSPPLPLDHKIDTSSHTSLSTISTTLRSEFSNNALTFFGVAHQVNLSLGLSNLSHAMFHDDPDEGLESTMRSLKNNVKSRLRLSNNSISVAARKTKFLNFQRKLHPTGPISTRTPETNSPGPSSYSSHHPEFYPYLQNDTMSGGLLDQELQRRSALSPYTLPPSPHHSNWEEPPWPTQSSHVEPSSRYYPPTPVASGYLQTPTSSETLHTHSVFEMEGSNPILELDATSTEWRPSPSELPPDANYNLWANRVGQGSDTTTPEHSQLAPQQSISAGSFEQMRERNTPFSSSSIERSFPTSQRTIPNQEMLNQMDRHVPPFSQEAIDLQVDLRVSQIVNEILDGGSSNPVLDSTTMPQVEALKEVFPLVGTAVIETIILKHSNDLDAVIEECERKQESLSPTYAIHETPSSRREPKKRRGHIPFSPETTHYSPELSASSSSTSRMSQDTYYNAAPPSTPRDFSPMPATIDPPREYAVPFAICHQSRPSICDNEGRDKGKGKFIESPTLPPFEPLIERPVQMADELPVSPRLIVPNKSPNAVLTTGPVHDLIQKSKTGKPRPDRPIVPPKPQRLLGQKGKVATSSAQRTNFVDKTKGNMEDRITLSEGVELKAPAGRLGLGSQTDVAIPHGRTAIHHEDDLVIDLQEWITP